MAYATQDDMVRKFGSREVIALTDRDRVGEIGVDVLAGALDGASGEIDTYLAARYRLPLSSVPRYLVDLCCDMARYHLVSADARDTDEIRSRYNAAVKFLGYAADGKVTLGVDQAGATVQSGNTVQFDPGTRIFSSRDRGAY
ncbi:MULTISPECIES: gp436 family protein [Burkholderia]|uniref:gp436 family protein n=1 Tax=Burkholderia TaxID=32008 RepID=UPI000F5E6E67|nr:MULTISPECIES: phage protein Gp36 family protein [Burkholderia]RQZ74802.1 DUF1320 domain-containing protein [Burkholderia glumae]